MNNILFADPLSEISAARIFNIPNSKRSLRRILLPMIAVSLFASSLLFATFVHLGTWITGYGVASLEAKQDALLRDLQALKLEEAVLKRPERIRSIAQKELDLIPASKAPLIRFP